jgi:hypothetical protein
MNTVETTTPRDLLTETIADLLVMVGGYKDAAEASRESELLFEQLTSIHPEEIAQAASQLRRLAIQAQGATNLLEMAENDDADQSFRFVAPEANDDLPAGNIDDAPRNFDELLQAIFGDSIKIIREPAQPGPARTFFASDRFVADPFGGYSRVG